MRRMDIHGQSPLWECSSEDRIVQLLVHVALTFNSKVSVIVFETSSPNFPPLSTSIRISWHFQRV